VSGSGPDRRELIVGGAALAGLAAAAAAGAAAPSIIAFADLRDSQSVQFAEAVRARGGQRRDLDADVIVTWRSLPRDVTGRPATIIAGLTNWSSYLTLRGCAADSGYRVRFEARHDVTADRAFHRLSPGQVVADAIAIGADRWPESLALALIAGRRQNRAGPKGLTTLGPASPGAKISWLLA
jgi:phosphodiesterase/alkaline phosphatase D-like protein